MKAGLTHWEDYLVVAIYFIFVLLVASKSIFRKNKDSVKGYFLAGRSMTWIPIGASLFASNIGSEHFVGLAGSGAASGIGVVSFEWGAVLLLVLLGWVFLPIYLSAGVFTMPEYLGRRFGGQRMRIYLSLIALVLYVATKVSVDMYAGVFFIQLATGLDMYLAMIPLLGVTALYTLFGGLAAVVMTDLLQTVVMLVGAIILCIMSFVEVGGWTGLYTKYAGAIATQPILLDNTSVISNMSATTTSSLVGTLSSLYSSNATMNQSNNVFVHTSQEHCGYPRSDAFSMFRDPVNSDLPWPGVVFRATFASLWNWCADQVIVQRALAAKNMAHARGATVLAGYLKFTPLFLIIMPGMISRILYTDEIACVGAEACFAACGNEAGCSNSAYPYLILKLAPVGLKGLLMAVMVAALMSSLTSIFNSAVTVFTLDLWRTGRPSAKDRELLIVGRIFVIVLAGVSIAWIPLIKQSQSGQLFMYIQSVTGYIAPPISAIFLLAILVPRINEQGAFWGVVCGQLTGIIRLVLDFIYPSPSCGQTDDRPSVVSGFHFTYFSIIVFVVTVIVAVVVSLMSTAQSRKELVNLTVWTFQKRELPVNLKENSCSNIAVTCLDKTTQPLHANTGDEHAPVTPQEYSQWRNALRRFKSNNSEIENDPPPGYIDAFNNTAKVWQDHELLQQESKPVDIKVDSQTDEIFKRTVDQPWNIFLNINAVLLVSTLGFLCGFFH